MELVLKENPTLLDFQNHIKRVCKEYGWDSNNHLEIFLLLSEEIGELAKAIRSYTNLHIDNNIQPKINLEEEFADVFNYFLDLANYFEIDIESAYRAKIKLLEMRRSSKKR